ncbi:mechanosensitive ion channel protein MscS [bacterium]|nr:mechanosensitive ion channel protein MscS [bacterium]|tara:strand:+ start:894 stop:1961 length:1068 start_codon:yes stop_codon:yes gene_type:complete
MELLSFLDRIPYADYVILGNSVRDYVVALAVLAAALIVFRIFQQVLIQRFKKFAKQTKTDIDDMFLQIVESLRPPFYVFLAFYVGIRFLAVDVTVQKVIDSLLVIWVVYQVVLAVQILIDYGIKKGVRGGEDKGTKAALGAMSRIVKWVLWAVAILFVLSNLGVNVSSVLAGLGIGGIAIALAAQNILGDLFSSFAIYFDKPFMVGDFIVLGKHKGTVEKIGIKTTRLRSLSGEEIVISNKELTSTRIQNFRRMEKRRIAFKIGVIYETSTEKLKKIPKIVKEIFNKVETAELNRVHFAQFDDFALTFEIVYYVTSREFEIYMDTQQDVNFALKERFEKEGIEFAYPTQMVYVKK